MYNKSGIRIIGIGSFSPVFAVTNDDFANYLDTDDKWITERTGIKKRKIHTDGYNYEMAAEAAKNALSDSGASPLDIDYIIVSTATPDYFYPTISCNVAAALGAVNAACVDISAACTGFVTGLDMARSHLLAGDYKKILVIASEKLSSQTDYSDRSTCVLFGDGAGAVVVEKGDGIYSAHIGALAESADNMSIYCKVKYDPNYNFAPVTQKYENSYLRMDGTAVYKFAVEAMPKAVKLAIEKAGLKIGDLDLIVPHQANIRIIKTAVKALGIPWDKVYVNIENRGNTSSSCIPTCLDELKKSGRLSRGMKVCFVAFGAGLTYGAVCFEY